MGRGTYGLTNIQRLSVAGTNVDSAELLGN